MFLNTQTFNKSLSNSLNNDHCTELFFARLNELQREKKLLYFATNCQNGSNCFSEQINLCKQEQSMKRASGGEYEGPGAQSIPWEPLTHAKLQSLGLELPARPSNCLQVPGETTKRSNCEEIWLESVFSEKKVSLKQWRFGRGGSDAIQLTPSTSKSCIVWLWQKDKNKKETTVNSDAKIPERTRQRWRQNCFVVLEIILQASASNLSAGAEPKKIAFSLPFSQVLEVYFVSWVEGRRLVIDLTLGHNSPQ